MPSAVPGKVTIFLSRSPNFNTAVVDTSLCQFEYVTDLKEMCVFDIILT